MHLSAIVQFHPLLISTQIGYQLTQNQESCNIMFSQTCGMNDLNVIKHGYFKVDYVCNKIETGISLGVLAPCFPKLDTVARLREKKDIDQNRVRERKMKNAKLAMLHCVKNLVQHLLRSFTSLAIYSSFNKKHLYAKNVLISKTVIHVSHESAFSIHFT
jgi:hypothetical protein